MERNEICVFLFDNKNKNTSIFLDEKKTIEIEKDGNIAM